jgi:Zn-dependent protease
MQLRMAAPLDTTLQSWAPAGEFTQAARKVVAQASAQAAQHHADQIRPEHLLLAILEAQDRHVERVLAATNVDTSQLGRLLAAELPPAQTTPGAMPAPGPELRLTLRYATKEATLLGHRRADVLHLLLGLLYEEEGAAHRVAQQAGLSLYELRQSILSQPKRFRQRHDYQLGQAIRVSPVFLIPLAAMIASGAGLFFGPTDRLVRPLTMLFIVSGWIVSVCIHEFGHALAAYLGGDHSVKDAGYLTLNPLKYSHPLLSIVLPLVFLLSGGIGLPGGAVYINPRALRSSRWESIVSAAGPLGTTLFGLLVTWPFFFDWMEWMTPENWAFWPALALLAFLQVTALLFNLIPLPPLDGFGIIAPRLSPELRMRALMFGNITLILMFVMLSQEGPISYAFWNEAFKISDALHIPSWLIDAGWEQFFS